MNRGSLSYLFKGGENPPVLHHFPQPYVRKAIYLGGRHRIQRSRPSLPDPRPFKRMHNQGRDVRCVG